MAAPCVGDREKFTIDLPQGSQAGFAIVGAGIVPLDDWTSEDQSGILEINAVIPKVGYPFSLVPLESHVLEIHECGHIFEYYQAKVGKLADVGRLRATDQIETRRSFDPVGSRDQRMLRAAHQLTIVAARVAEAAKECTIHGKE